MKIAVLDYASGSVDIERYLSEEKGYRLDDIYWMEAKCINIHI